MSHCHSSGVHALNFWLLVLDHLLKSSYPDCSFNTYVSSIIKYSVIDTHEIKTRIILVMHRHLRQLYSSLPSRRQSLKPSHLNETETQDPSPHRNLPVSGHACFSLQNILWETYHFNPKRSVSRKYKSGFASNGQVFLEFCKYLLSLTYHSRFRQNCRDSWKYRRRPSFFQYKIHRLCSGTRLKCTLRK